MPRVHRVEQGDCLASIAHRYGFGTWRAIYDHPDNEALRAQRPDPHVLAPGDTVVIPDKAERSAEVATGAEHSFRVRLPRVHLRLHLRGRGGEPLADTRYEVEVGGQTLSGTTDGDGLLEEEVPADATSGRLRVFAYEDDPERSTDLELAIGHLDPVHEDDGARARLRNLGYPVRPGGDDGDGESLARAVRRFQKDHELEVSGALDDATLDKLQEVHKS